MNQELKALRNWLRMYGHSDGNGIFVTAKAWDDLEQPCISVTAGTVSDLAALIDKLEQESEHVDGIDRNV